MALISKMGLGSGEMVIISGSTHPNLVDEICQRLDIKPIETILYHAGNRETMVNLKSSVRFKDVFIIQTATECNVNDAIMELLLLGYTCHTSASRRLVGVIPYLPYGKQARQRKRGSIPSRLLAKLICRAGFHHLITVDLQHREIQGFFDIPVENLRASPFLIDYLYKQLILFNKINRNDIVIVAKHSSAVKKATAYSQRLKVDLAILHGNNGNDYDLSADTDQVDGRSSPPPEEQQDKQQEVSSSSSSSQPPPPQQSLPSPLPIKSIDFLPGGGYTLPVLTTSMATSTTGTDRPFKLVGDVNGKLAILVENIIDNVEQSVNAARFLKQYEGARTVLLVATHSLFNEEMAKKLQTSDLDEIIVTNTIPHESQSIECPKLKTIDISILLTEAIRRLHNNESLSYLFTDVSIED